MNTTLITLILVEIFCIFLTTGNVIIPRKERKYFIIFQLLIILGTALQLALPIIVLGLVCYFAKFWICLLKNRQTVQEYIMIEFAIIVIVTILAFATKDACIAEAMYILSYLCYIQSIGEYDRLTNLLSSNSYQAFILNLKAPALIIILDVDDFKEINDNFGHDKGDEVLMILAEIIRKLYGDYGKCFRRGGDEFAIIMEDERNFEKADSLNSSLIREIERARVKEPVLPRISYGTGIAKGKTSVKEAIKTADDQMYENKQKYKKSVESGG